MTQTVGTAPTRSTAAELLAEAGVTGPLAERMLRRTARQRHAGRVEQATAALLAAADGAAADLAPLVGALVAHLDSIGVGITGQGTDRHPALERLGKGRKHATDGGAWTAAITEAAQDLPRIAVRPLGPADPRWHDQDSRPGLLLTEQGRQVRLSWEHPALPMHWLRRLAEEAVAHLCGAPGYLSGPLPEIRGSAAEWSALWQEAHRRVVLWEVSGTYLGQVLPVETGHDPWRYWLARFADGRRVIHRGRDSVDIDGVRFRLTVLTEDGAPDRVRADIDHPAVVWPEPTEEPAPDDIPEWERELQARAEVI